MRLCGEKTQQRWLRRAPTRCSKSCVLLEERIDELERLQRRDSTNSSLPPSREPPSTRQQRRALAKIRDTTVSIDLTRSEARG